MPSKIDLMDPSNPTLFIKLRNHCFQIVKSLFAVPEVWSPNWDILPLSVFLIPRMSSWIAAMAPSVSFCRCSGLLS